MPVDAELIKQKVALRRKIRCRRIAHPEQKVRRPFQILFDRRVVVQFRIDRFQPVPARCRRHNHRFHARGKTRKRVAPGRVKHRLPDPPALVGRKQLGINRTHFRRFVPHRLPFGTFGFHRLQPFQNALGRNCRLPVPIAAASVPLPKFVRYTITASRTAEPAGNFASEPAGNFAAEPACRPERHVFVRHTKLSHKDPPKIKRAPRFPVRNRCTRTPIKTAAPAKPESPPLTHKKSRLDFEPAA